jgi:hypothetical protein
MSDDVPKRNQKPTSGQDVRRAISLAKAGSLLRRAGGLLLLLGALSLALSLLLAAREGTPAGEILVFSGGGLLFFLLGMVLRVLLSKGRAIPPPLEANDEERDP